MVIFSYVITGVAGLMVGVLGSLIGHEVIKSVKKRSEKKELEKQAAAAERKAIMDLLQKNSKEE